MSDFVLVDGDSVVFETSFGLATVVVQPGTLSGSGPTSARHHRLCVGGDESGVSVSACPYKTVAFPTPGTGTLKIGKLGSDQTSKVVTIDRKPVLLVGTTFTAVFQVDTPATQPGPPMTSDATVTYSGSGRFVSTNTVIKSA